MENLQFSIPFDGNPESLQVIFTLNQLNRNRIREIYLAGPQEFSASARIMPKMKLPEFIGIIQSIHAAGIRVNLLLNSVCEGTNWYNPEVMQSRMEYIGLLHETYGLEAITIANPIYIKEVKKNFPKLEICASVLSIIDSVQRAIFFRDMGADVIIPDKCINRDLKVLKGIKDATNAEIKLMVNSGCLYKCPFERFHGAFISHKSLEDFNAKNTFNAQKIFFQNCSELAYSQRELVFQSAWTRPEDLRRYKDITSFFKISGRSIPSWATISQAYIEENWDGNLLELMDASLRFLFVNHSCFIDTKSLDRYDFFNQVTGCSRDCRSCSYCAELAHNLILNSQ